ncbi:MAG: NADH-ubiquinone oxidoreductase chain M [uncultured Nocardioidaceae bacterium]|uniref:NADH-ubiquinone oxidoreductase chain M n=1 Tax=uncultured Nocardioidaceae bacterium TaxID=253824 RepID=A0A6J4MS46_9ACTN|nr:MAG: NADH-ubiquinone oxidoreductase chain M [uncultured Nocardioidaceae bacterium]
MTGSETSVPWLTILALLPLLGAGAVLLVPRGSTAKASVLPKQVALGASLATFAVSVAVAIQYDVDGGFQFVEQYSWIDAFGASYAVGLDGLGLLLVLLTTILTPVVILASWHDADAGRWSVNSFFAWMLVLEGLSIGVFAATDVFLFYVLFEATLVPIYFLIGGFGGARRSYAAVKFLLYSLFGGLLMLASVVGLYVVSVDNEGGPSYLLEDLMNTDIGTATGRWLFLGFFIAFAVKAPMWPVHTWLPDAASESTSGTSVLLVSVLDKIGTFGMMRFCLNIFPEASRWATPVVITLAVISVLYGALLAIGQEDIRRLIAYTSVSHFGFMVLGIFAMTSQGQAGSALYMFNHGLSTAALFLVTGFLISRRGSKMIGDYGGVEKVAPVLAGCFLLAGLSSLSLPGLSPFVSEFLVLAGTFTVSIPAAVLATFGIVLAAVYILYMYQRTMTGPTRESTRHLTDLRPREMVALAPLLVLIVVLGFFPQPALDALDPTIDGLLEQVGVEDPEPTVATEGGSS